MNYIAFLFTAASITGTLANSFQKKWCYWVWICTNSFWCVFNTINGQYAQALLYVFNLATCVIGLLKWRSPVVQIAANEPNDVNTDIEIIDEQAEPEEVSEDIENPYERMSKALADFATAFTDAVRPTVEALTEAFSKLANTYYDNNSEFLKWQASKANPRLLHRAYNAKRYRTRKKNLARLHREYKKYIKKGGGRK